MKFIKFLLFLALIAIIGLGVYIAVQPNTVSVTRTHNIKAPAAVVYNTVIDLKNWENWLVWTQSDPELKITLSEKSTGINAVYGWENSRNKGSVKTIAVNTDKSIDQDIQFNDDPLLKSKWNFLQNEADNTTEVTWNIAGNNLPFMYKAKRLLKGSLDAEIGAHMEQSLQLLDSLVTRQMDQYTITHNGVTQYGGGFYIYNTTSCKISELPEHIQTMMPKVGIYATNNNIVQAGPPFLLYHKFDQANDAVIFSACIPTTSQVVTAVDSGITTGQLMPFKAVKTTLKGHYKNLSEAWEDTFEYIATNGYEPAENGIMLEVYVTDPQTEPNPANWITEIYVAIK